MADPSFNLKTGADSQVYYSREVTENGADKDKIKSHDGAYKFPVLARQTGNSVKGTTETLESNELRKGRTKSAPRKGNSSAEGSLDFELSPLTYDDFFEAALRGEWTEWKGDYDSTNKALQENVRKSTLGFASGDYCFSTKCAEKKDSSTGFGKKKLFNFDRDNGYDEGTKAFEAGSDSKGLFQIPKGSVIHELNCGTKDIKYMLLRQFGGVEGEDLYQKFDHMAVNTISNDISVGQIITGSVGFMGANDPKMQKTEVIGGDFDARNYSGPKGEDTSMFLDGETTGNSFIENLPNSATQTDQFTAREGFLYLNGVNIEFANAMNWELNNGLEKNFAIFVRNAIATSPLTLDITGNITTYLIHNRSEDIFNAAVDDEDNEILWCIEDNEDNPKYLYIFQIFKSKFTDHDASVGGAQVLNVSFPFQSFGEQAIRVFRVTLPVDTVALGYNATDSVYEFSVRPTVKVDSTMLDNMELTAEVGGTAVVLGTPSIKEDGTVVYPVTSGIAAGDDVSAEFTSELDGESETVWTGTFIAPDAVVPPPAPPSPLPNGTVGIVHDAVADSFKLVVSDSIKNEIRGGDYELSAKIGAADATLGTAVNAGDFTVYEITAPSVSAGDTVDVDITDVASSTSIYSESLSAPSAVAAGTVSIAWNTTAYTLTGSADVKDKLSDGEYILSAKAGSDDITFDSNVDTSRTGIVYTITAPTTIQENDSIDVSITDRDSGVVVYTETVQAPAQA